MRNQNWTARRKLLVSLVVLALVMVVATIAQFTGRSDRNNPYYTGDRGTAPASPSPSSGAPPARSGERAVFGSGSTSEPATVHEAPSPVQEEPLSTRARTEPPAPSTREQTGTSSKDRGDIDRFLARWSETVTRGDVDGQTGLYAPKLTRFFRQRNVSNSEVRKVKARMMSLYPTVKKYDISDVKVESNDGSEAVISFRKEWDMAGQKPFAGAERQRLRLRKIGGDWKIVSEEELKVYWTRRS